MRLFPHPAVMKCLILRAVLAVSLASSLFAQTVTLSPVADVFVSSNNAALNYGGAGALAMSASGSAKGEFDSLLRFDFSSAKSSFDAIFGAGAWTLQSVKLTLTAIVPANAIFNTSAAGNVAFKWIANDSWVEGAGTPNIPTTNGIVFNGLAGIQGGTDEAIGTFAFSGATSGTVNYSFNLTPSFTSDATAGNLVSFLALPADATVSELVDSQNFNTPSARPLLTVVAVPEPGGAVLAFSGLLVLAARRGRLRADA